MYPLIPVELLQTKRDDMRLNEQNPSIVMVDEQPPKVKNIEKSPTIHVFTNQMHFVCKKSGR